MRASFALLVVVACSTQSAQQRDKLDPSTVMIDAERLSFLLTKAFNGVGHVEAPQHDSLYRADAALKAGAATLLQLRNAACAKKLVQGDACVLRGWPRWAEEPPTDTTPIEELDRRSAWLFETMKPFTRVGCEAGRKALADEHVCSVE